MSAEVSRALDSLQRALKHASWPHGPEIGVGESLAYAVAYLLEDPRLIDNGSIRSFSREVLRQAGVGIPGDRLTPYWLSSARVLLAAAAVIGADDVTAAVEQVMVRMAQDIRRTT